MRAGHAHGCRMPGGCFGTLQPGQLHHHQACPHSHNRAGSRQQGLMHCGGGGVGLLPTAAVDHRGGPRCSATARGGSQSGWPVGARYPSVWQAASWSSQVGGCLWTLALVAGFFSPTSSVWWALPAAHNHTSHTAGCYRVDGAREDEQRVGDRFGCPVSTGRAKMRGPATKVAKKGEGVARHTPEQGGWCQGPAVGVRAPSSPGRNFRRHGRGMPWHVALSLGRRAVATLREPAPARGGEGRLCGDWARIV